MVLGSRVLEGLLKLPENRECADCKSKYSEKRWASQDNRFKSPSKAQEEMDPENKLKSSDTGRENINFVKSLDKKDNTLQSTRKDNRVIPKVPARVPSESKLETGRTQIVSPEIAPARVTATTTAPSKVECTAAELTSASQKNTTASVDCKNAITGAEDLFKDSSLLQSSAQKKHQTNKNGIMCPFDKCDGSQSSMVSPFGLHQQQQVFLSQQKAFPMAADKFDDTPPTGSVTCPHPSGSYGPVTASGIIKNESDGNEATYEDVDRGIVKQSFWEGLHAQGSVASASEATAGGGKTSIAGKNC
ncbi:Sugar transporter [Musa troglodytarum]|uniref:Sugar transporter n=1 Tax=Musa troglodytarum TaxID=320322 RepID=A0A9E7ELM7_9LILI|nr:Sugar transporter [Musa troglodytarum]